MCVFVFVCVLYVRAFIRSCVCACSPTAIEVVLIWVLPQ